MKFRKAATLVELLIAFAISMIALVALIQISTKSVSNSSSSRRQSVATNYAREGMEWIRQQKGTIPWDTFYAYGSGGGTTYCINAIPASLAAMPGGSCGTAVISGTEFSRTVRFSTAVVSPTPSGRQVQQVTVYVDVAWSEGKGSGTFHSLQEAVFTRY